MKNNIQLILDESGEWTEDSMGIMHQFNTFYQKLFNEVKNVSKAEIDEHLDMLDMLF